MRLMELLGEIENRKGEKKPTVGPKRGDGITTWGKKVHLGDCEVQEVTIGELHFRAIDFGDTIRLSERSRAILGNIEPLELNRCVLLHAVAGAQWRREGRKNGIPTLSRALAEAEVWR